MHGPEHYSHFRPERDLVSVDELDFIEWEVSRITDDEIEMRLSVVLLLGYLDSNQD